MKPIQRRVLRSCGCKHGIKGPSAGLLVELHRLNTVDRDLVCALDLAYRNKLGK
jgi:hypothetical protein